MNERIENLSNKTDEWCDANFPPNWTDRVDEYLPLWNQKFAELIVQECIDILNRPDAVMKLSQKELSDYNQGWVNGRKLAVEHIEKTFRLKNR